MDPRHPEQAISRMRELMKQYDRIESDMNTATTSAKLAQLEREGGLVVQEICLVAPRIHEAMMQTSRQRRHDISRGVLDEPQDTAVELSVAEKEEKEFARLLIILDYAKKRFLGKDARKKETGEVYTNLKFTKAKPFAMTDDVRAVVFISMDDGENVISFCNLGIVDFLNEYEPVEKDANKNEEKVDIEEPDVNEKPKKKTTRKKKTIKKKADK